MLQSIMRLRGSHSIKKMAHMYTKGILWGLWIKTSILRIFYKFSSIPRIFTIWIFCVFELFVFTSLSFLFFHKMYPFLVLMWFLRLSLYDTLRLAKWKKDYIMRWQIGNMIFMYLFQTMIFTFKTKHNIWYFLWPVFIS